MQYVNYGHLVAVSTEKEWEMSDVARNRVRVTGLRIGGYAKGKKVSVCSWFNTVLQEAILEAVAGNRSLDHLLLFF